MGIANLVYKLIYLADLFSWITDFHSDDIDTSTIPLPPSIIDTTYYSFYYFYLETGNPH